MSAEQGSRNPENIISPHERAQDQFDSAVHLAQIQDKPVGLTVGENGDVSYEVGDGGTIFEAPLIPDTPKVPEKKKRGKIPKTNQTRHSNNLAGLTGFYKGTFYENGAPRKGRKG